MDVLRFKHYIAIESDKIENPKVSQGAAIESDLMSLIIALLSVTCKHLVSRG